MKQPPDYMIEQGRFQSFMAGLDLAEREWASQHGFLPKPRYAYRSPHQFVREHGEWYEPVHLVQGLAEKLCYHNSILLALAQGWTYVEGFALVSPPFAGPAVVQHAWVLDPAGEMYETTWFRPGLAYLGVVFSAERADNATWHGDATTLDDDQRDWPLLRQPWTGEDPTLTWEPSPALGFLRAEPIEWEKQ